jgi:Mn2+/Fe2+ NRAMP family transporter
VRVEAAPGTGAPPARARRPTWAFGPGLVFALAALGPQDLVTNSAAGASYGYALLWSVALVVLARYVLLEATARYVVVTGETLMRGYSRAGRWVPWMLLGAMLLRRHLAGLAHLLLLAGSLGLLFPDSPVWLRLAGALASWAVGFALMCWGRYKWVERASKPLLVILGGSLALAAVASKPDLGQVARGVLLPSAPSGESGYSLAFLLLALVGAGTGALSNLKYAAFVHEKGWREPSYLRAQRIDLVLSGLGLFSMLALVQIAAAANLYPSTQPLRDVEDLLPMFARVLGDSGRIVLGLSLWAAVFTTYTGANTGYSLLAADIWHNVLRPPRGGTPASPGASPAYRWFLIWFCLSPLYALFTEWKPVWILLLEAVLLAALLPVMVGVLLWLTNRRDLMGRYRNSAAGNAAMLAIVAATGYLVYRNLADWWPALSASIR